jgi:hypothetical protein
MVGTRVKNSGLGHRCGPSLQYANRVYCHHSYAYHKITSLKELERHYSKKESQSNGELH